MASKHGPPATFEQIAEAIESLDDAGWLRLRKAASAMLWGTGFAEPDDLINEALTRTLDGDRTWPVNVPFVRYLINAMRSVADGERQVKRQTTEVLASGQPDADDEDDTRAIERFGDGADSAETLALTEEARLAAQKEVDAIEEHFKSDPEVTRILMGIEDQLSASEIRNMSGMTQTQYETARKRLRRGTERLFPQRRKP